MLRGEESLACTWHRRALTARGGLEATINISPANVYTSLLKVCSLFLLMGALALASIPASAQQRPYDTVVERGRTALEDGQYNAALQEFMSALEMVDGGDAESWRMLLAIAVTYDQMGQLGHSAEFHRKFLMRAQKHAELLTPAWSKRVERAKGDVERIMKKASSTHGFLSVVSQPPGATLVVDGRPAGAMGDGVTPFLLFLEPGVHTVRVTRSGYQDEERTVKIAAAAIRALDIVMSPGTEGGANRQLLPVEEVPVGPPAQEPTIETQERALESAPREASSASNTLGPWVTVAGGGAALLTAAVLTGLAAADSASLNDEADALARNPGRYAGRSAAELADASREWDATRARVDAFEATSIGLYALGGVALVGGFVWLALSTGEDSPNAAFSVTPVRGGVHGHASVRF